MPASPRTVHSDEVMRIAYWQNVVILDVAGHLDLPHMKRMGQSFWDLLDSNPEGFALLAFIRPGVPIAPADARAESASFMKELGDRVLHAAILIEDTGVLAQAMATVIRGINVLARTSKLNTYRSLDDAIAGVLPHVHARGDAAPGLRHAVRTTRADYSPRVAVERHGAP